MKTKLLALVLLGGSSLLAETHFSVGINLGGYPPPPPVAYAAPPCPGPDYSWIDGYWYPNGSRYAWNAGYWARRPYSGAFWVAPRYEDRRYHEGYWRRDFDRDRGRDRHERGNGFRDGRR